MHAPVLAEDGDDGDGRLRNAPEPRKDQEKPDDAENEHKRRKGHGVSPAGVRPYSTAFPCQRRSPPPGRGRSAASSTAARNGSHAPFLDFLTDAISIARGSFSEEITRAGIGSAAV